MKTNLPQSNFVRARLAALLSIALLASTAFGQQAAPATTLSTVERELGASVKVETIREVTTALAADAMQGRGTAQPGGDKAAAYLADHFSKP